MRENETPYPIWIKFCRVVGIPDVITYGNFGDNQLRVYGWQWVKFFHFPLAFVVVFTTVQHSRTTMQVCDEPFLTKFQPSPNLAIVTLDSFVVFILTLIPQQLAPLPPPSFTSNLITGTVFSHYHNRLKSQITRLQQIQNSLTRAVKASKSCHITPILHTLHWLKLTECVKYKLLSLT